MGERVTNLTPRGNGGEGLPSPHLEEMGDGLPTSHLQEMGPTSHLKEMWGGGGGGRVINLISRKRGGVTNLTPQTDVLWKAKHGAMHT